MFNDTKAILTSEQIAEKIRLFNLTSPYDWSIFDDVPESQQVNVMYPFTFDPALLAKAAAVTETGKKILGETIQKLEERGVQIDDSI